MTTTPKTNKDLKTSFDEMWNDAKFNWNGAAGKDVNPQRIWNAFILPALTAKDTEWQAKLDEAQKEIIICAAIQMKDGYVVRGHRHHNCGLTVSTIQRYEEVVNLFKDAREGFITSHNRFVGREEAYKLFVDAGCKSASPDGFHGEILFSEDLY